MPYVRSTILAAAICLIAPPPLHAEDPLSWQLLPGDGFGAAILTNCSECDYIEMAINCAEGSGEVEVNIALDVKDGNPGDEHNVTFLFGDGAIERRAVLITNEMDGIVEPSLTLPVDDELLQQMRTFEAAPHAAEGAAGSKDAADAASMEILVENGPSKTIPLRGASETLGELVDICEADG